jgi:1-acyl-sn-glycerol-3-phosphate acyltransferase
MGTLRSDLERAARGWRWGRRPLAPRSADIEWLDDESVFPTDWARGKIGSAGRAAVLAGGLKPLLHSQVEVVVEGLDNLAGLKPPVVFVANHSSHLDAPLVLCSLPPSWRANSAVGAASDYFFDSVWKATATTFVFGAFPIERRRGRRGSLPARLLESGWNLVFFPEGTRSPDGWMHDFRAGAAFLCSRAGVPAVPIGIEGAYRAMPKGRSWPVPGRPRVAVRFGRPQSPSGQGIREFSDRLVGEVARLVREDQTTWWESLKTPARDHAAETAGPEAARWRRMWEASRPR